MVANRTWAVIGGALGAVGIAGALTATAGEPRDPVDLDAVEIASTADGTVPAATPGPDPAPSPSGAAAAATDDGPADSDDRRDDDDRDGSDDHDDSGDDDDRRGGDDRDDSDNDDSSGPTVVSPPSPVTAETPD